MTALARRLAALGLAEGARTERLAGGDLSEVLLIHRRNGAASVAKASYPAGVETQMLRAIADAGVPVPKVEAEYEGLLLMEHVPNDGVFSPRAWESIGVAVRSLHDREGSTYGWPVDFQLGTVALDNRQGNDWCHFFGEQRLLATAKVLDRPWRERIESLCGRMPGLLPAAPPASLLHGDLWSGNILVRDGTLAALIDPACYYGHGEVDLAMLSLFSDLPPVFNEAYGPLEPGWEERRAIYQLFPALVHLRLFGTSYATMVDRLLRAAGV